LTDQWKEVVRVTPAVDADTMLQGYRDGVFAMSYLGALYLWMSPLWRGVLPLDNLRVTRSLRKSAKRYTVTFDAAFDDVVAACADPRREGGWIDDPMRAAYRDLFERGHAHSVEAWDAEGRLSGGLFVVNVGGLVSGESMFHVGTDASKVALMALVHRLREHPGPVLLDTQWCTDHLATMGVIEIPRKQYRRYLASVVNAAQAL
jgi:leucyl/phenylalanyl-tRNA--protein transferase